MNYVHESIHFLLYELNFELVHVKCELAEHCQLHSSTSLGLYLWHLWTGGSVLVLVSFGFEQNPLGIQRSDAGVGLELDMLPVRGDQLQGVAGGAQVVLSTQHHQEVHERFAERHTKETARTH